MSAKALVALVTGGASGIGEATACKLASRGVSVLIGDLNKDRGESLATELRKNYNVRAEYKYLNVSDETSVRYFVKHSTKWTGRLDFAANCAGICESVWDEEQSITAEIFDR
jgi:NAD(P)-dependent dehydrogenase (short-subunit alcohol dehydrogenase family)